jgi:membrane-associated phospholipid phosphatase
VTVADHPVARDGSGPPIATAFRPERGLVQVVGLLWIYAIYDRVRTQLAGSPRVAAAHAKQVALTERMLGLNVERTLQQAALHVPWLAAACNLAYSTTHLVVPLLVLFILYRRAPHQYRHWRNVFLVLLGVALLSFWLYPLAPPRLVPGTSHVVDTAATEFSVSRTPVAGWIGSGTGSTGPSWTGTTNPFAAMPSLHVAWALWAALAIAPVLRRRRTRIVVAIYPAVIAVAVIVTGNHWMLDIIGGVMLVGFASAFVTALDSLHARVPNRTTAGVAA